MEQRGVKPVELADREGAERAEAGIAANRAWWRRVPQTLRDPGPVFRALRDTSDEDVDARAEPITAIAVIAGMAGILLTPAWGRLMDDPAVDGALVVAVVTFIGGSFYGAAGYFLLGLALWLGAKGVGVDAPFKIARQIVAFAAIPLALSIVVTLPAAALGFGYDWFRTGGGDVGIGRAIVVGIGIAFGTWSLALLAVGLRVTFSLPWRGVLGAMLLAAVMVAAVAVLPTAL